MMNASLFWIGVFLCIVVLIYIGVQLCKAHLAKTVGGMYTGGARKFRLSIREPGFSAMLKGEKTVDLRLKKGVFSSESKRQLKVGDAIIVARSRMPGDTREYDGPRKFNAKISGLSTYDTFNDAVTKEKLANVFGKSIKTADAGIATIKEFYPGLTVEDEKKTGILAIKIADVSPVQPNKTGGNYDPYEDDEYDDDDYYWDN